jgi:hypothetical protein
MPRAHPRTAALLALAALAAWAIPSQHLHLLALRELFRAGESVGITTIQSRGGQLGGQILGFNYCRPPSWYAFTAQAIAAAISLAPILLPALYLTSGCHHSRRGRAVVTARKLLTRAVITLLLTGLVFVTLDRFLGPWLYLRMIDLGERLGGSVSRISGFIATGPRGPFSGERLADSLGNFLTRHGPRIIFTILASIPALILHARLWRRDLNATALLHLCPTCGYDLRATPATSPCPECGRPRPAIR